MAALRLLADLEQAARPALPEEKAVLARWSGWGAVPAVFDETDLCKNWRNPPAAGRPGEE